MQFLSFILHRMLRMPRDRKDRHYRRGDRALSDSPHSSGLSSSSDEDDGSGPETARSRGGKERRDRERRERERRGNRGRVRERQRRSRSQSRDRYINVTPFYLFVHTRICICVSQLTTYTCTCMAIPGTCSSVSMDIHVQRSKLMPAHMPRAGKFGKGQQRFTKYMPVGQASSKPMG